MRIELIWIYDGAVHPTNRHRQTDHSRGYWVWLLRRGSVALRQGQTVLTASAGECLVSPRGLMEQNFSEDARILSIHFTCEWPTGESLFREREGCVFRMADFPGFLATARQLADFVKEDLSETDINFASQPVAWGGFLQLQRHFIEWLEMFSQTLIKLGFVFTPVGAIDRRLLSVVRCLKETSLDSDLPIELIQKECGLGRSQLDRLFVQQFGTSMRNYWNRRKLESAKALLANNTSTIKEVGFGLGFKQASHFTKWFRMHADLSPVEYRQREQFKESPPVKSNRKPRRS